MITTTRVKKSWRGKKKKRTNAHREEDEHQIAFFQWLKLAYPDIEIGTFHIPNGGKRNPYHVKAMGIKAGVPDIFMPVPTKKYPGLFIEMKRPGIRSTPGRLTKGQVGMMNYLLKRGYHVVGCWSWEEAKIEVERYLAT